MTGATKAERMAQTSTASEMAHSWWGCVKAGSSVSLWPKRR